MVNVPVGTDATYARLCDFALKKKMDINIYPTLNVLFSLCLAQSFSNWITECICYVLLTNAIVKNCKKYFWAFIFQVI